MSSVNLAYAYPFASSLQVVQEVRRLRLATSGGVDTHPHFFQGRMVSPRRTCDSLLTVSEVSRTRFYSPTEMRERMLAAADPVVTSGGERLRFEAFSVCCGVYARLDLRPNAIDGEWTGRGTTNVDFNPPMRGALSQVLESEKVGLNVGEDGVELTRSDEKVVEKKVKLPVRWLKGFVEVQAYQADMKPAFEVRSADLLRVLKDVGEHQLWQRGSMSYLVPAGKSIRLSQRESAGAIPIGAPGRLKVVERLLRHAKTVRFYNSSDGVTGIEVFMPEASFFLVLSPDASRGFSGEGQALSQLASSRGMDELNQVKAELKWQAKLDSDSISRKLKLEKDTVDGALSLLGTRGLVGYDLSEGAYFHRELPFDLNLIEQLHPRIEKARKLVQEDKVRIDSRKEDTVKAFVKGTDVEHLVTISGDDSKCTCPWYSKHPGERGPCSHILAVDIVASEQG